MTGRAGLPKHPPGGEGDIPLACLGYHAAMRWILTTVLLAASALVSLCTPNRGPTGHR